MGCDVKNSNCFARKIIQKVQDKVTSLFKTNLIKSIQTYRFERDGKLKMQISTNEINDNIINAKVTEFPLTGLKFSKKKEIGLKLEFIEDLPFIRETFETANVKFSSNDKYLPFRFILDDNLKLKSLTRHFIKEKNLDKLNIKVTIHPVIFLKKQAQ